MSKEIISDRHGIILLTFFIVGAAVVLPIGIGAGKDLWIATGAGIIMSLPLVFIYANINKSYPSKDLFQINTTIFGAYIGNVINLLYIWFGFFLGSLTLKDLGEFVVTVTLPETPRLVPMVGLLFLCIWGVKSGIEVLGRWGEFFLPVNIIVIIIAVSLLTTVWNIKHILPVFQNGIKPILRGAYSALTFPYAEIILFTGIFSSLKWSRSTYKVYLIGLLLGGLIVTGTTFSEILTLGIYGYKSTYFPSYSAVARINIGDFIQRLEIIVAFVFLSSLYIKTSICLLFTSKGISRLFGLDDYRDVVIPIGILMIIVSEISFIDITELSRWSSKIWPIYTIPFQIIIPILIFIGSRIQKRIKTQGENMNE